MDRHATRVGKTARALELVLLAIGPVGLLALSFRRFDLILLAMPLLAVVAVSSAIVAALGSRIRAPFARASLSIATPVGFTVFAAGALHTLTALMLRSAPSVSAALGLTVELARSPVLLPVWFASATVGVASAAKPEVKPLDMVRLGIAVALVVAYGLVAVWL